ncbi:SUMF1/EgtB/PvdO family nonheme iron enzyme [Phormidium tenue FACHB-886]|nr:SUMF1/EgtB/PvdO family nonheme iron enzyme [Phormidium tenue FACHB-886]
MKILILASNPRKDLHLDREVRDLKAVIERSHNRQQLEVVDELAVRVGDLQDFLFKHQPQIVHFCGHGSGAKGLVFEGNEGGEQWVRAEALSDLFRLFAGVKCVLLNACYSEEQADAIVTHIDYVIGMRQTIRDDAAIAFSKGFYRALGYECSIEQSYEFGCNAIQLEISGSSKVMRSTASEEQRKAEVVEAVKTITIPEHLKPILKKKPTLGNDVSAIPAQTRVAIQVEVDKALEEEDASLKEYREQVKEYLADRRLEDYEKVLLDQLRDELGLTIAETEGILIEEQAPILQAKQAYVQRLNALIQGGFYPFNEAIEAELRKFQARRNLTDAEVTEISQPIFAAAEAARQAKQSQQAEEKRHQYRQELIRATQAAYPSAPPVRIALKNFQQSLGLSDAEVEAIEQPILDRLEAEHQARVRQRQADRQRKEQEERQRLEQAEEQRSKEEAAQQAADRKAEQEHQAKLRQEADRQRRAAEEQLEQVRQQAATDRHPMFSNWSRRRVIRTASLAALGAMGTGIAVTGGLLQQRQSSSVTVNEKGEIIERRPVQSKGFVEELGNGIRLEMVEIPGGAFQMGAAEEEQGQSDDELPQHQVTVSSFAMGKFEVTQAQWRAIASLSEVDRELNPNPSKFEEDNHPVENVSWNDAIEFCARLSHKTGKEYRLPSEAEWEYACRAGTTTPFHVGATLSTDLANYDGENIYAEEVKGQNREQTIAVGNFPPNDFGLYDMHGNVREWCADRWHDSYEDAPTDGSAWMDGVSSLRVLRGGSWFSSPRFCRSANRNSEERNKKCNNVGFRVVCAVPRTNTESGW